MKKKYLLIASAITVVIVLSLILASVLESSDEEEMPSFEQILEGKLVAYQIDLEDSLDSFTTNEAVATYLTNWANHKGIDAETDKSGNVIFTISATDGYGDEAPAALICTFDADNIVDSIAQMAIAMCVAKNTENHGKVTIIFLSETNGDMSGASNLSSSYFTDDTQIFYLGHASSTKVSLNTGGYSYYTISKKITYQEPSYDTAYTITITGCPSVYLDSSINSYPNPIKILGEVLANFKSGSLLFELASFDGGESQSVTASSATMTIVINSTDENKFLTKMDKYIDKFTAKYGEAYPDISYTYEKVELPDEVFFGEDTDDLVSLMYTAFDGVYEKDDNGNVIALNNIGAITSGTKKLTLNVASVSSDQTILDELSEAYSTICALCNMDYAMSDSGSIFSGAEISADFLAEFEATYLDYTGDSQLTEAPTVAYTPCSLLQEKNPNLQIIYCAITDSNKHKFSGSIITYLAKKS